MQPYGGFWWRVLAYFIDYIILQIGLSVLSGVFGIGLGASMTMMDPASQSVMMPSMLFTVLGVSFAMTWLYFALMESSPMQATVGKLAVGLVVTDLNGNRISFARATGRFFAKFLSSLILMIGYIMVAFSARKQGLHDMLAGTLVWKTRDPRSLVSHEDVFR
ncbi:RDD family protein [Novosphingobium album (ex Hu et al. 2023)]|uniref:RDD family protein n=1 Tax=Novosphingobium album (ex Hu et al. 2023) TaxID=2930093 RepID=A0ABT0AZN2_9SPHN|nr:RDD family protein [Novosphingobium album (ex Hu et al. 2023)]MCJ2178156.1 RDD family protein [Novosphingobium album (ex Hu et al. 2023)]